MGGLRSFGPCRSVIRRPGTLPLARSIERPCQRIPSNSAHVPLRYLSASVLRSAPVPARSPATPDKLSSPTPPSPDSASLPEHFRSLMRLLPHSVVVCTSLHPPSTPAAAPQPRAMTMSSLTSLSLSPSPLLSFNVKRPSRTLDALTASGRFSVHVLSDDARGARVAEWFSRGDAGRDPFAEVKGCGCDAVVTGEGSGVELRGRGVRRVVRCRVEKTFAVRDHVIVVGEVEEILSDGEEREGLGLAYADRSYRKTGGVIQRHHEEKHGSECGLNG